MLLFTASAHFTSMKEDLIRMVPSWVPGPRAVVFLTGICELLGAFGLLLPSVQRVSGIALILFLWPSSRPMYAPRALVSRYGESRRHRYG